jgi:hypothetical protein
MLKQSYWFTPLCALLIVLGSCSQGVAQVPKLVNYQGSLSDSQGKPLDTTVAMTFFLYADSAGTAVLWSESQTAVKVRSGLFSVLLGSSVTLPQSLFNGSVRWLRVQVGSLVPSQPPMRIVSVAYAFKSQFSDTASVALSGVGGGGGWADDGTRVRLITSGDSVGIGIAVPKMKLDVSGDINSSTGYGVAGVKLLTMPHDNSNIALGLGAGYNCSGLQNSFLGRSSGYGVTTGTGNTLLGYTAGYSKQTARYNTCLGYSAGYTGDDDSNNVYVGVAAGYSSRGSNNVYVGNHAGYSSSYGSYNVFIGNYAGRTETDSNKLYIANNAATPLIYGDFSTGRVGIGTSTLTGRLSISHSGMSGAGVYVETSALFGAGAYCKSTSPAGAGVVGEVTANEADGVRGKAVGTNGNGIVGEASGNGGHGVFGKATGYGGNGVHAENTSTSGIALVAQGGTGSSSLAALFYGNVQLRSPVDSSSIMILGKGLDYAEGFDIGDGVKIEPGNVVVIDPLHPGQLALSKNAHDHRVAGIVAGANNLGSGVRLGAGSFDLDVALAGRVYCFVDATQEAIEPGDLLTTSATPGHAMKVTDYAQANGAIIGKAMEPMAKGCKGKILVLVSLQ